MTSSPSNSEASYGKVTAAAALTAVGLPVLVLGLALAWYARPPSAEKSRLVVKLEGRLAEGAPRVVVLGNSLSAQGVDEVVLGAALAEGLGEAEPLTVTELDVSGSSPPIWYAVLENLVYGSDLTPDLVLVPNTLGYFLQTDLPSEKQRLNLAEVSAEHEPVIGRVTYGRDGGILLWERVKRARSGQQDAVMTSVREVSAGLLFAPIEPVEGGLRARGRAVAEPALAEVFEAEGAVDMELNKRVIPVVEIDRQREAERSRPIDETYIAALVSLAAEKGSRIVFVRVPLSAANASGRAAGSERLPDVVDYLNAHGAGWIDLSTMSLPETAFWDRSHLSKTGSRAFSEALAGELLRIKALEPEAAILEATAPLVPDRAVRSGTTPIYHLAPPIQTDAPCAWRIEAPELRRLSAAFLKRYGLRDVAPLVLLEDGRPLEPVVATAGLGERCTGQFRHSPKEILFAASDNEGPAAHDYTLGVASDAGLTDRQGAIWYWIPPGSTLALAFDEPWDARRGDFKVDLMLEAFRLEQEDAAPRVAVAGVDRDVVSEGVRSTIEAAGEPPAGPWEIRIEAPPEGPWFLVRALHVGGPAVGSWVVGDGAAVAGSQARLLTRSPLPTFSADPRPVKGKVKVRSGENGTGLIVLNSIADLATARVRKLTDRQSCSPVRIYEDGEPLRHPNAPCAKVVELGQGRMCHATKRLKFSSSDGTDVSGNGRSYTVGLDPSRRCKANFWLYPGDTLTSRGKDSELAAFRLGARSLQVAGVSVGGGEEDAPVRVSLLAGGEVVLDKRIRASRFDGSALAFDIDPPIKPGLTDVALEVSSKPQGPFVLLTLAVLSEVEADELRAVESPPDDEGAAEASDGGE